jgi:hypothetical protein
MAVVMVLGVAGYAQDSEQSGAVKESLTDADRSKFDELDKRPLHQMTNVDLAEHLSLRTKAANNGVARASFRDEMALIAKRSIGQPYRLNAVQFDLAEGDCVSLVNRNLAMAVATDWPSYVRIIERLRHKDGIVDYKNRNFFTLGDWLPNNAWLLRDVTAELGPADDHPAKEFTHVVRPKRFEETPAAPGSKFSRVVFLGSDYTSEVKEVRTDSYVPVAALPWVAKDLETGDVLLILRRSSKGHLGCDHMGMVVVVEGKPMILHSAPPRVKQEDLARFFATHVWVVGFKCLRVREDAGETLRQEIDRMPSTVRVPLPAEQDASNTHLRLKRGNQAK